MKSKYELTYEKLVTSMILSENISIQQQLDLFFEFHENSYTYYDTFCDALYELSCGHTTDSLWMTPSGKPYLSPDYQQEGDHRLLTYEQVPVFKEDLQEQLETALTSMRKLSSF